MFQNVLPVGVPHTADHDVSGSYDDLAAVEGVDLYDGRGYTVHLGRPDDVMRVSESCRSAMDAQTSYIEGQLGLVMPKIVHCSTPGSQLNGSNGHMPVTTFKLGQWAVDARQDLQKQYMIAERWENKAYFLEEMSTGTLPEDFRPSVPKTWYSTSSDEPRFDTSCWFKPCVGASGNGAVFCDTAEDFVQFFAQYRKSGVLFQIQQHVEGEDLSAQLWITDDGAQVLTTTDQIMGGVHSSEHMGNIFPSAHQIQITQIAQRIGDYIYLSGYRGPCGFDFVRCSSTGEIYVLEMNARWTGAHYPGALAGHLNILSWRHIMVSGVRGRLRDPGYFINYLQENDFLWTPDEQRGVIPWYVGTLPTGKVMLLLPGNRKQQENCLNEFRHLCC